MRIAIIGSGRVGSALGRRFGDAGHEIVFGSRTPDDPRLRAMCDELGARALSSREAAVWAEVVVLAVPWGAAQPAVDALGDLDGTILIDATNPVSMGDASAVLPSELGFQSGAEMISAWAPSARVVKAFNTTGAANLGNPSIDGFAIPAFVCGEPVAVETVAKIARSAGFDPVVVGGLERAHLVEASALLWITLAQQQGMGPDFAFVVARR